MISFPEKVKIKEVGPRDGLQNEAVEVPWERKVEWINLLSAAGYEYIEFSSFVHPKWIPQLKDADIVARSIDRNPGTTYAALVPNVKGLRKALDNGVDEVAVFMSASETHNKKNINKTINETYPVLQEVITESKQEGKKVRGYISCVFGCPYEGHVPFERTAAVAKTLLKMGVDEISLGDTIGTADPKQVDLFLEYMKERVSLEHTALHFHNTNGMALANVTVALQHGITIFDASLGGLGGCPYAEGASGNLATDDLVHMLHRMGIETGINEEKLRKAAAFLEQELGKRLPSHQRQIAAKEEVG
ncbi:UNVERIFIED_CONTAM: hydroxymethylglutaryl-CoA lyase [Halobacillus marinus]|uniref:hydroxymethylglutaryl-CoA lyase n=1 Tax=Bacillus sp. SB49 TaxID=1071080 RepID=UPI0003FA0C88|nr:hydroxymethylglutaryl-CoA lyase [Bacillus sp. SB49]QHT46776.1 hydroxymethylglutaryl-CoA lyase [Bacillus sp. SB49]